MVNKDNIIIFVKDYDGLNINSLSRNKQKLENYNGYLPLLLYCYIEPMVYYSNLNEKDYNQVINTLKEKRKELIVTDNKIDYQINELIEWVNNNPSFKNIIRLKGLR